MKYLQSKFYMAHHVGLLFFIQLLWNHIYPSYWKYYVLYSYQKNYIDRNKLYTHLTHWGRVTYICVVNLTINGSDNGLSSGRRQAIIWTNAGMLLIAHSGTNFSDILMGIQTFSFNKMHFKMSSAKWRVLFLGLKVLKLAYSNQNVYTFISLK